MNIEKILADFLVTLINRMDSTVFWDTYGQQVIDALVAKLTE